MKTLLADFHIHTLLSPCAEIEMTPHHIVMRAAQYGVDAVAITDHNASANAAAAVEAAKNYGVRRLKQPKTTVLRFFRAWKLNAAKKRT